MRSILESVSTADATTTLDGEYRALTGACGLIDRSERGKLALAGPDAVEFLNGQVTNELAGLRAGEGCYAAFLTHKGKMLGDLRVLAVGGGDTGAPSELLLDTERVALQGLFDMINRFKVGHDLRSWASARSRSACSRSSGPEPTSSLCARSRDQAAPADGALRRMPACWRSRTPSTLTARHPSPGAR